MLQDVRGNSADFKLAFCQFDSEWLTIFPPHACRATCGVAVMIQRGMKSANTEVACQEIVPGLAMKVALKHDGASAYIWNFHVKARGCEQWGSIFDVLDTDINQALQTPTERLHYGCW